LKRELTYRPLADLIPYANNSRTHSDEQVAQVAASIRSFGFNAPILIDENNGIVAGHCRAMAAKKLKLEEVPCIELTGLTDAERRAYVIADNQLTLNGGWDIEKLQIEIEHLTELDFDIDLLGFDDDFLANLLEPEIEEGLTDEDAVPEVPEEPVSKEGDVWILGNHRLMCGDSTSIDAVEKLMDGNKADMVFTDPPYNVNFKGSLGSTSKGGKMVKMSDGYTNPNSTHRDIANDKMSSSDFNDFITEILSIIKLKCVGGWYVCFSSSTLNELLLPLVNNNMKWKSIIIWNKNQSPMGGGHFRRKYEPIAYGYFSNLFYGKEYAEDDVWDISRTVKNDLHPTMKPVELVKRAVGFSSNSGGSCLDLFGGSGSTLIACEELSRKAYLMELDPKYCDVIIKRWQDFTGKEAVHESGETFAKYQALRTVANQEVSNG